MKVKLEFRFFKNIITVALFATSLFAASILYVDFSGFRLSIFRVLIFVVGGFVVIQNTFNRQNKSCVIMLIWLCYALFSFLWVSDKSSWLKDVFFIFEAYVLTSYFSSRIDNKAILINSCRAFSLFIAIHNLIGYYEMFTHNYINVSKEFMRTRAYYFGKVPVSVFYNSNNYATVLLLGIALTFICVHYSKTIVGKVFYLAIAVSSAVQIWFSLSRANALALIVGVVMYFLIRKDYSNFKIVLIMFFVLCGGILLVSSLGDEINMLLVKYFSFDITNGSESLRLELIQSGWQAFVKTYGLGTGAGNLATNISSLSGIYGGKLHFWWLEVLFTYGIFIFALYILNYFGIIVKLYKRAKSGDFISTVFCSLLVAYIIGAISPSSVVGIEPIWAVMALVIAYTYNYDSIVSEDITEV